MSAPLTAIADEYRVSFTTAAEGLRQRTQNLNAVDEIEKIKQQIQPKVCPIIKSSYAIFKILCYYLHDNLLSYHTRYAALQVEAYKTNITNLEPPASVPSDYLMKLYSWNGVCMMGRSLTGMLIGW